VTIVVDDITQSARRAPLVMRCGAFGDMVLLTVLLAQLRERFGTPVDVIASGPWCEPLLHGHPAVGSLLMVRSRRTPYWLSRDQQALVSVLRARGAGPTWFCERGEGRELLARAAPDPPGSATGARDARCSRARSSRTASYATRRTTRFSPARISPTGTCA
jgi:hypothetical protein